MNFVLNKRGSPGQHNLILLMRGNQFLFRLIQGLVHPRTFFKKIHTFKDFMIYPLILLVTLWSTG